MNMPLPQPAAPQAAGVVNAMSVDVEDWFQVGAFERSIDRADWDSLAPRVEDNTLALLDLFARTRTLATFFTLGWVAQRFPRLIRRIAEAGHEVASHGYDHKRVFTLTPDQFRADLEKARTLLEDASGTSVTGYRAPSFSIDGRTPWAHAVLAEQGYSYSSSVAPLKHDHYGQADAPRFAYRPIAGERLIELPPSVMDLFGRRIGAGGGFFRMLPYAVARRAARALNDELGRPSVFYFHPWEIDPGQPRVAHAPLRSRVRHYSRLAAMEGKLERLLTDFAWDRTDRVAALEADRRL